MDEKDWDVLLAVYEEKNVTLAAQKLFVSQPALSYRLKQMEEEFQIQIFVKGKKQILFTKEGESLVQYAKKMKVEHLKLKDRLAELKQQVSGELRLTVSSNFAEYELPDLLKSFHDRFPNVQLNVHTEWSVHAFERLANEEAHIGIIRGDYNWDDAKILLSEDEVCIVSKKEFSLADLPHLPRISHRSGPDTKKIIDQWWQENFTAPPHISMEVGNVETCKKMVLKGLGYGILPKYILKEAEMAEGLFLYPLTLSNGQPILRKLWAFYREQSLELSVVKAFVEFLKERSGIV